MSNAAQDTTETKREIFLHTVEVEISTEESGARTKRLLEVLNEIDKIEADKASRNSDFNAELKQKRKEAHKVRDAINLGKERRDIECYEVPEERTNTVHICRASDGKVLDERAMTLEDRMYAGKSKAEAEDAEAAVASPSEGQGGGANDTGKAKGAGKVTRIRASDVKKKKAQREAKEAADKARAAADDNDAANSSDDEDDGA